VVARLRLLPTLSGSSLVGNGENEVPKALCHSTVDIHLH
jgi:hypothetical protein